MIIDALRERRRADNIAGMPLAGRVYEIAAAEARMLVNELAAIHRPHFLGERHDIDLACAALDDEAAMLYLSEHPVSVYGYRVVIV